MIPIQQQIILYQYKITYCNARQLLEVDYITMAVAAKIIIIIIIK